MIVTVQVLLVSASSTESAHNQYYIYIIYSNRYVHVNCKDRCRAVFVLEYYVWLVYVYHI